MDADIKKILLWGGLVLAGLYVWKKYGSASSQTPVASGPVLQPPGIPGATDQNLNTDLNGGLGSAVLSGQTF